MLILIPNNGAPPMHFEFGVPIEQELSDEKRLTRMIDTYPAQKDDLWTVAMDVAQDTLGRMVPAIFPDARRLTTVVECIGRVGLPANTAPVRACFDHREPMVRRAVVRALGQLSSQEDGPRIADRLRDPDSGVRKAAAIALGCLANRHHIPMLEHTVSNDVEVSRKAMEAVRRIQASGEADPANFVDALLDTEEYEDLVPFAACCWPALVRVVQDRARPESHRARAARVLYLRKVQHAGQALREVIVDDAAPRQLKLEAVRGCGFCNVRTAYEDLLLLLYSRDAEIRWTAVAALGRMADPAAFEPLLALWNESELRLLLRLSLRRIGTTPGHQALLDSIAEGKVPPGSPAVIHQDLRMIRQLPFQYIAGQLQHQKLEARRDAVVLLAAYGGETYQRHLENVSLNDPDESLRVLAQRLCGGNLLTR